MPNHSPEHYPPKEKMLRGVSWHLFFGDLSQSEKLSKIKPPLGSYVCKLRSNPIQYRAEKQPAAKGCQKNVNCHFYLFEKLLLLGQDSDSHRTSYVISTCHHMYIPIWLGAVDKLCCLGRVMG